MNLKVVCAKCGKTKDWDGLSFSEIRALAAKDGWTITPRALCPEHVKKEYEGVRIEMTYETVVPVSLYEEFCEAAKEPDKARIVRVPGPVYVTGVRKVEGS